MAGFAAASKKLDASNIQLALQQAEDILVAVDKYYYSYCQDPSTAPTLDAALLISQGWVTAAARFTTPISDQDLVPSVTFTAPQKSTVSLTLPSTAKAGGFARAHGAASVSGSTVTISRTPRVYNHAWNGERAVFSRLFSPSDCLI